MIAVQFNSAGFVRRMSQLLGQVRRPRAIMAAVGREGRNQLVKHFRQKDRTGRNRLGGKREHFWLRIGRSVQTPLVDEGGTKVTISINDPRFAQKVFGGVIQAKRARSLTIPVHKDSYGRSAGVFEQETGLKLFLLPGDFGAGLLAAVEGNKRVTVYYVLRKSVRQDKDPTALPDPQELEALLLRRAESETRRLLSDSGGQT